MIFRLLADATVIVHLGFVAFVRVRRAARAAMAPRRLGPSCRPRPGARGSSSLAGSARSRRSRTGCARRAARRSTRTSFVERYLLPVLYPSSLSRDIQWALGALVILVNAVVYAVVVRSRREESTAMKRVCVFAGSSARCAAGVSQRPQSSSGACSRRAGSVSCTAAHASASWARSRMPCSPVAAQVTGVIPGALVEKEVAHSGLTDLRIVTSMHERKALMADLSDAFIALPGGWGTLDEFFEILTWAQLGLHRKPCGLLNVHGYFDGLLSFLEHSYEKGFVRREYQSMISVSESPGALLERLAAYRAAAGREVDRRSVNVDMRASICVVSLMCRRDVRLDL